MAGATITTRPGGVAGRLYPLARLLLRGELPVGLRAWDGSTAGPQDGPVLVLNSPRALRRLVWQPGELGLARAYVSGDLDVDGQLTDGLRAVWQAVRERDLSASRVPPAAWADVLRTAISLRVLGPPPPAPAAEAKVAGRLHSRGRDRAVISHHYDVPAEFYRLVLDPSMAYSCALWRADDPGQSLADAQRDKLDLSCRKLELAPGARLLDIGCGWGSLSVHAARDYGAQVTAVTLAAGQAAFVRERMAGTPFAVQVDMRHQDYRDIAAGRYDAVASIEMGEHVGDREYPAFCTQLRDLVRPGGRVLIQQMSRGRAAPGGGKFIEGYVAPDMHMRPAGQTISLLEAAGLEVVSVESMREDYVRTIRAWLAALEACSAEATALIGAEGLRVWRLYLAGGALAFAERRMSVHQILAVRPE